MLDAEIYDAVIIGAGAAGLFCAAQAGKLGKKVIVLDHANKVGKKILMSGGGRCNFTNMYTTPENYLSQNPHFCKSALSQYTQWDFIALVDEYKIPYHEKKWAVPQVDGSVEDLGHGQLFCDNSSKDILNMLLSECDKYKVIVKTHCEINEIEKAQDSFKINTSIGEFESSKVVVATGGLSIPKMGATGLAYQLAKQFEINTLPTRAGLVPFVFTDQLKVLTEKLSGLSQFVDFYNDKAHFSAPLLFTHRGLSGPAALQLSSYWQEGESLSLNVLPKVSGEFLIQAKNNTPKIVLRTVLNKWMPKQFVLECENLFWSDIAEKPIGEVSNELLQSIQNQLQHWQVKPSASEGYRTAEVTLGGIDTDELSSKTMECKKVQGLYFIGEAVDVTGHLGGYNFQWAWSSGFVAAQSF